jgi:hypothetical protein
MADDLDAEFALFEQEIGGLDDEGTGDAVAESSTATGAEAFTDSSLKDTAEPKKSEKITGVKRSVQTVYSSAPVTSAQEEEPQQVDLVSLFQFCRERQMDSKSFFAAAAGAASSSC